MMGCEKPERSSLPLSFRYQRDMPIFLGIHRNSFKPLSLYMMLSGDRMQSPVVRLYSLGSECSCDLYRHLNAASCSSEVQTFVRCCHDITMLMRYPSSLQWYENSGMCEEYSQLLRRFAIVEELACSQSDQLAGRRLFCLKRSNIYWTKCLVKGLSAKFHCSCVDVICQEEPPRTGFRIVNTVNFSALCLQDRHRPFLIPFCSLIKWSKIQATQHR